MDLRDYPSPWRFSGFNLEVGVAATGEYNARNHGGVRVSLCKVSIAAERSGEYSRKFIRKAEAEIETPSEFGPSDLVTGRFLGLRAAELLDLLRLKDLHLHIEGHRYRLLSVEDNGAFIAVKEA